MKKLLALILVSIFAGGAILAWVGISFISTPASDIKTEVILEVPQGTAFYSVANQLQEKGLIQSASKFSLYAKLIQQTTRVKVGEYRLYTDMKPREILNTITSGESIAYQLTIPEGDNIYEIKNKLNALWAGRGDEFFKLVTNPDFIKSLTGESLPSLEGYLFPETYLITKYTPIETLARRMYDSFQENIRAANLNAKSPMPTHEQVILASVIEKETGATSERNVISSVFHNRLSKKMKLQSDPTILYGLLVESGDLKKNISKADIMRPTPYNTYTVRALPFGPIANPGLEALRAAVNPIESEYLFFVSRNDGTHVFSENYGNHNSAVKKFQVEKKNRVGKSWRDLKKKK